MQKLTHYVVLYAELINGVPTWKEEQARAVFFDTLGRITEAVLERKAESGDDIRVMIDDVGYIAREATGMFDKAGMALYGGDIVKVPIATSTLEVEPGKNYTAEEIEKSKVVKEMLAPIVWINGAYCLCLEGWSNPIYLTQQNVLQMEKVGNMYQHSKMIEEPIDEKVFETKEGSEITSSSEQKNENL